MTTTDSMRQRLIDDVAMIVRRPGLFTSDGSSLQGICTMRLHDLLFLDGEEILKYRELGISAKYGKCGVVGPFQQMFGGERRHYSEVASVFAEIFHRYGYFTPDRLVPVDDWGALLEAADTAYTDGDARMSEAIETFGEPSLKIGTDVLCYAPEDGTGWVFVDCYEKTPEVYEPGRGFSWKRNDNPLIRDIRLPSDDFEAGLRLTLYGKILRWGPGWWISHPDTSLTDEQLAIGAQLRAVQAADPSQPEP